MDFIVTSSKWNYKVEGCERSRKNTLSWVEKYFSYKAKYTSLNLGKYIACVRESRFVISGFSVFVIKDNCERVEVCELWWVIFIPAIWVGIKITRHNSVSCEQVLSLKSLLKLISGTLMLALYSVWMYAALTRQDVWLLSQFIFSQMSVICWCGSVSLNCEFFLKKHLWIPEGFVLSAVAGQRQAFWYSFVFLTLSI